MYDFGSSIEALSVVAAGVLKVRLYIIYSFLCVCMFLQDERGAVVLSGCGTSGRLGFITAVSFKYFQPWYYFGSFSLPPLRLHHHTHTLSCVQRSFNQLFPGKFHYTIAGGDRALLLSTEAPEDSWQTGVDDLEKVGSTQFLT